MVLYDVCHRCGSKIFNGTVKGKDPFEFIEEMKKKGYQIGYNDRAKPICSTCSDEDIKKRNDKIVNQQLKKIIQELKKVYVCPLCTGYIDNVFTCSNKNDMVQHLKEKHHTDLKNIGDTTHW